MPTPRARDGAASDAPAALRVLLVEDHAMVAEMLTDTLTQAGFTIAGVARTADEGLARYRRDPADLVLCDVQLRGGSSGIELTRQLTGGRPKALVLMLSAENEPHVVREALAAGASGFVSKGATSAELFQAIEEALSGMGEVADRDTYRKLVLATRAPRPADDAVALSPRERQTLQLMAEGTVTNQALATAMCLGVNSVRSYVDSCMRKLGVHRRAEAVAVGLRLGLITPPGTTGIAQAR